MIREFFRRCRVVVCLLLLACAPSHAVTLTKSDVDNYLSNKYVVGDINPSVPVWPLFARGTVDTNEKIGRAHV